MTGYPRPDFSSYFTATGSLGFILLIAEYTILKEFVTTPLPKHALGGIGLLLLLHGLYGLRKKEKSEPDRLHLSVSEYQNSPDTGNEYADVARDGDELPESEMPQSEELEEELEEAEQ